jgi:hypothetical protein
VGGWWSNIAGNVNVGGDVVDDEDELMKYSKLLEEDLDVNRCGDLREVSVR